MTRILGPISAGSVLRPSDFDATDEAQSVNRRIHFWIFLAALFLIAPGFYYFVVAVAWAPAPYVVALLVAEPDFVIIMIAVPQLALYFGLECLVAYFLALWVDLLQFRWSRRSAVALILLILVVYAVFPGYQPVHGHEAPDLNLFDLMRHAFGPQLPGAG